MAKKMTVADFKRYKDEGKRYTMITCYDAVTAAIVDASKVEVILAGDSVGNVVYGYDSTIPVTLDQMILATKAVVKGAPNTFIVGDMPFATYNVSCEQAVETANRLMKEGGCDCVKLEGGANMADKIAAVVKAGIPVMGHIGLTPQTVSAMGGLKVQGKTNVAAMRLFDDLKAIEEAGAFCCVIECVPTKVGNALVKSVDIPVFAAGDTATGYGMNFFDMTGMFKAFCPKFVKQYLNLYDPILKALNEFHDDVDAHAYPAPEHMYNVEVEGF